MLELNEKPIAFFDSGVGGLTVFSKMKEVLPNENYLYFGDLKNSPYGEKTKEELIKISKKIFNFLEKKDVKAVVMACNTTSATAYEELKENYSFKIYPLIQSCAKKIADMNYQRVCIFATEATVKTHAYEKYITQNNKDIKVYEIACPEWVNIVEENKINTEESKKLIKKYLDIAMNYTPDKIILGCTHYPFLINIMEKFIPKDIILNPSEIFVEHIKNDLSINSMLKNSPNGQEHFIVSQNPDKFKHAAELFYKLKNLPEKITL
jgi:glutamate racemase